jgi:iron complex transport system substrate-binding protein
VPETAALPKLLTDLGFTMDRVVRKAGNPRLFGTGDSFEVSPERLADVADAPTLIAISVGGPTADELAKRRIYARLPAFRTDGVFELPASSYRPDYYDTMNTLARVRALFSR